MSRINFRYSLSEGIKNFFLNGFMTFAAVGIIAACLLVTGSFTLLAVNIDAEVAKLQKQSEITAYVDISLSDEQAKQIQKDIESMPYVSDAVFFSKDQALEEYRERLGKNADVLDGLEQNNPLRHSYRIKMSDIKQHETVTKEISQVKGIAEVKSRGDISEKLINFRRMIDAVCIALIAMLGAVSIFIISNTVKLATFARREEIAIMKMVGATNHFVRVPFIIEGLLLGEMGAVIAFFMQWMFYAYIEETVEASLSFWQVIPFAEICPVLAVSLCAAGIVIGAGGSALAIRKFLKV